VKKNRILDKLNPAVEKHWLQLAAGLMWSGVGIMLVIFASRWLKVETLGLLILTLPAGLILGSAIYLIGFSKLARKNIRRIEAIEKVRVCIFAFQEWKTYPLVLFMIGLGIYLRLYSTFPKPLLAIMYLGIGTGLFASSIHYYQALRVTARAGQKENRK
jgi:hypothetical protein